VDKRRIPIEFQVGDLVFLKAVPMKGVIRFSKREKLNPRYIRPFKILERISKVAYRLALLPELAYVHKVFHILMLKKYATDPSHVLHQEPVEVHTVQILAREEKTLGNKLISRVKVL